MEEIDKEIEKNREEGKKETDKTEITKRIKGDLSATLHGSSSEIEIEKAMEKREKEKNQRER